MGRDLSSPSELLEEMREFYKDSKNLDNFAKEFSEREKKSLSGEVLNFRDFETGEEREYFLRKGEEICEEVCLKDGVNLIYFVVSQVGAGYHCPNCNSIYQSPQQSI